MRVSDYVITYLKENFGVDTFFTVSGGGCIFLIDSLTNVKDIKYIPTHHEQCAAMAAEGYFRMHDKLGVCIVTSGPGGTNAITGLLNAYLDSIPILIISGQVNRNVTTNYTKLSLRQLGDQEFNIVDSVKNMSKYAHQINDPQEIKYHLDKACHEAFSDRPGPVWLDIPLDVQSANIDPEKLVGFINNDYVKPKPTEKEISILLEKLNYAKKPLLIVGNGIRLSKSINELKDFLKLTNIPVISAVNGNDIINDDYYGYVGRFGTHAQICANNLIDECDLIISVGSRLYIRQIGYNFKNFAKNAYKIYVDIDENELKKPTLYPDLIIKSDAKLFFENILKNEIKNVNYDWIKYCKNKYDTTPTVLNKHRKNKNFISNYFFIEKLNNHLKENDHIVTSNGSANVVTMQVIKLKGKQRLITNTGSAPMGYGLPAAIGACSNNTPIICIEGDGSLHLNIHELQTVFHHNLPIKIILLNNDGYNSIKLTQKSFFDGKFVASEKNSGVSFPNFKKISEAYNLPYYCLNNVELIDTILTDFLHSSGPALLEVFVDPNEVHEPKVMAKLDENGKFIPGNLEDIKWID